MFLFADKKEQFIKSFNNCGIQAYTRQDNYPTEDIKFLFFEAIDIVDLRTTEEILEIKSAVPNAKIIIWNTESPRLSHLHPPFWDKIMEICDIYCDFSEQYKRLYEDVYNLKFIYLATGLGRNFSERARKIRLQKNVAVSFVGRLDDWMGERRKRFLAKLGWLLKKKGIQINTLEGIKGERAWGASIISLTIDSGASVVGENSARKIEHVQTWGLDERFWQVPVCKCMLLADKRRNISNHFTEGYDIITYKNEEDCAEKAEFFIKNNKERNKIIRNAYFTILLQNTLEHRVNHLLKELFKLGEL